MGKVIDISDKLSFEENPKLKIKNVELEVNSDAATMLKIMQLIGEGSGVKPNDIVSMYELIFNENERKKVEKFKLQFNDFQILVMAAVDLVTGGTGSGE
ncbi:MAG: hypothetical protein K0R92_1515 [Lachnospiraceae bacterium]|jgi:hypothetical protein|nr:hypothetical protein [Lachnospiraceae bacterium]